MTEQHKQQPDQLHHTDSADSDSPEAFIERVRALYADQKTSLDELVELSRDESQKERFEATLEDITYEALFQNEEFSANARAMRSGTLSQDQQLVVRDRQRELFSQYREAVLREAGLSSEAALSDIEKSKARIRSVIESHLGDDFEADPMEILQELGILQLDENGSEQFSYPEGLFPKATDEKWQTYLETVRNHLKIERAVHAGTAAKEELGDADTVRRMAHNAVSRDVDEILGLGTLPDAEWDFTKTRNLLAKMRDSRFPTVETAEKFRTEKALVEGLMGAHAVKALVTRLADLHK